MSGFYYVATPYSKYEGGLDAAFREACRVTAELVRRGLKVYSPIAHTHPIAYAGKIDPLDHKIWLPLDEPLMRAAEGLYVVEMPGWEESYGIAHEVEVFKGQGKPVVNLTWPELKERVPDPRA